MAAPESVSGNPVRYLSYLDRPAGPIRLKNASTLNIEMRIPSIIFNPLSSGVTTSQNAIRSCLDLK